MMTADTPADTRASAPAPSSTLRPRQFSLSKLMLVMVACCVLAALAGRLQQVFQQASLLRRDLAQEREKNRAAQAEVGRLKREQEILYGRLGKLTIHDPNSIYLVALPARDEFEWKWRVFLPKGNRWRVAARHGIVSDKRLAADPDVPAPMALANWTRLRDWREESTR
jgi:hypothetical protein